ncbi:GNAT family N-acetyltransferase [Kitasatospora sp. NPDC050463]|uniref:GNAT family N-acetyltransferase n=1 Tax=Kitasatospora sp. NPDC050463 TaxID=3155786 RepID=UPI0033D7CECF
MTSALTSPVGILIARGGPDIDEVKIRRATAAQLAAVGELTRSAGAALPDRPEDFHAERIEEFCLIEQLGTVVACVGVHRTGDGAELYDLAVAPAKRGIGLGRLLVAAVLLMLSGEPVTEVRVEPGGAREWFTALGFTEASPTVLRRDTAGGYDALETLGRIADLQIEFQRSGKTLRWEPSSTALLMFAQRGGLKPESLCWAGVCGTCAVRIKRGTVSYNTDPGVDPEDDEVLLCITRPVTDLVLDL